MTCSEIEGNRSAGPSQCAIIDKANSISKPNFISSIADRIECVAKALYDPVVQVRAL